jgi:hypothetical protein
MQISDQFKISVSDLSVIGGTEHYVIGVERLDTATNKWIVV